MAKEVRLTMKLVDQVSGPGRAIQGALAGINKAMAGVRGAVLSGPAQAVAAYGRQVQRTAQATAPLGAMSAIGIAKAGRTVYEQERELNVALAAGNLTMAERSKLQKAAVDLNADFAATSTEIVQAANQLLKSGLPFEQMMGLLPSVLSTAQAMGEPMETAANAVVATASQYRYAMGDIVQSTKAGTEVADLFAFAVNQSIGTLDDFKQSSKYAAPVWRAMNVEAKEFFGWQLALAKNGILGSSAGTGLRSAPVSIAAPSPKARAAAASVGMDLSTYRTGGQSKASGASIAAVLESQGFTPDGIEDAVDRMLADPAFAKAPQRLVSAILDRFGEEMGIATAEDRSGLTDLLQRHVQDGLASVDMRRVIRDLSERGAGLDVYAAIFGKQHASKIMAIDPDILDAAIESVYKEADGTSRRMRERMMSGIVGDVAELDAALEKSMVAIGQAGLLQDASRAFISLANSLDRLASGNKQLLRLGAYSAIALAALPAMGFAASGAAAAIGLMISPISMVAAGLGSLAILNWKPIVNGLRTFGAFFRRDLSPSTVARFGQIRKGMSRLISDMGSGSAIRWNGLASRMGTGLADLANKANAAAPAMARMIGAFAGDKLRTLQDAGTSIADFARRAGPAFSPALAAAIGLISRSFETLVAGAGAWGRISGGVLKGVVDFGRSFAEGIDTEALGSIGRGLETVFGGIANAVRPLAGLFDRIDLSISGASEWGASAARGFNAIVREFAAMPGAIQAEVNRYAEIVRSMGQYVPDFSGIKGAIGSLVGVINSIVAAVNGAKESLAGFNPGQWGRSYDNSGAPNRALDSLPSQIPGKAGGGVVRRGHLYEINERGQEYFSPGSNGRIIPAHRTGGGGDDRPNTTLIFNGITDTKAIITAVRRDESRRMSRKKQTGLNRPME